MKIIEITSDGHESALSGFIAQWARINGCQCIRSKKWTYLPNLDYEEDLIFIGEGESAIWAAHLASRYESAVAVIDPVDSTSKVDDALPIGYAHANIFISRPLECDWIKDWNRPIKNFVSVDNVLTVMLEIVNKIPFICFGDGE